MDDHFGISLYPHSCGSCSFNLTIGTTSCGMRTPRILGICLLPHNGSFGVAEEVCWTGVKLKEHEWSPPEYDWILGCNHLSTAVKCPRVAAPLGSHPHCLAWTHIGCFAGIPFGWNSSARGRANVSSAAARLVSSLAQFLTVQHAENLVRVSICKSRWHVILYIYPLFPERMICPSLLATKIASFGPFYRSVPLAVLTTTNPRSQIGTVLGSTATYYRASTE